MAKRLTVRTFRGKRSSLVSKLEEQINDFEMFSQADNFAGWLYRKFIVDDKMDLPEANQLMENAGYKDPYGAVTLRNPLGPKIGNPYFIFGGNPTKPYVFVDTVTREVHSGH